MGDALCEALRVLENVVVPDKEGVADTELQRLGEGVPVSDTESDVVTLGQGETLKDKDEQGDVLVEPL